MSEIKQLMRSDIHTLPPRKTGAKSVRVASRKGLSRAELTVQKTIKGVSKVMGKGKNANTLLGFLLFDPNTQTWKYLIKGRSMASHKSFRTKKMAAVALGEML